ncbi:MAG: succinate dehydrogenase, cytochrome b556 subunit [Dokdonella sp.]
MTSSPRPLSPHLQVYRWQIQMITSILHRATGAILSIGSLLIVAALVALSAGPEMWSQVAEISGSWLGLLVLFGWTWAFSYHLVNGIRHLLQDAGFGYAIGQFVFSSWFSVLGSIVLTLALWGVVFSRGVFA